MALVEYSYYAHDNVPLEMCGKICRNTKLYTMRIMLSNIMLAR